MTTLVPSFLNGSSSFLQVTRTTIKAWMTLLFCQILQLTTELAAFEYLKINVFFSVAIALPLFKLADKEKMHNILDLLAHLSRRLRGELKVYRSSRRPSVRACIHTFNYEYI